MSAVRSRPRSAPLCMRDVMTATPHTIGVEQKLALAHRMMTEHGVRHLPVLRAGRLAGVLSQRDLYFLERIEGVDASVDVISDAMSPDVFITTEDAEVAEVARTMAERKYGCAVVVDQDRVVGIFTVIDALRVLAHALA